MGVSAEVLLMAAILGLYLYDSAQLLYRNEAVLIPAGQNDWIVGFGSEHLGVLRKELYIPNPLLMHRPMFRMSWQLEGNDAATSLAQPPVRAFFPLAPLVWSMAIALFVFLPVGFFTRLGEPVLLLALVLLFTSILLALAWTWAHRGELQLSARRFLGLAFESLVCPPFALNLIRHLSMATPMSEDLIHAARRLQTPSRWARTRQQIVLRLTNELEAEEENSPRHVRLQAHRQSLIDEGEPCRP
ncbi:MAG: hypothetical protein JNL33_01660 [Betaproteobacteria bacterium]|nr:hypothetical protein [Betaproteobacteria bacterium]